MKNIVKRIDFLSENTHYENLSASDTNEYDTISDIIIYEFKEVNYGSFNGGGYFRQNGEDDVKKLKKFLSDKGYNLDHFMKKFEDVIYDDISFTEECGFFDYLLYSYDGYTILGGAEVDDDSMPEDFILNYSYGFETETLGKVYINQCFDSIIDFFHKCAEKVPEYLNCNVKNSKVIYGEDYSICIINTKYEDKDDIDVTLKHLECNYIIKDGYAIIKFGYKDEIPDNILDDINIEPEIDTSYVNRDLRKFNL